jgi:hypothetical protein
MFFCPSLDAIGIALLVLLSLIIGFSVEDRLVVADIKDQISSVRGNTGKREKPRGYGGRSKS